MPDPVTMLKAELVSELYKERNSGTELPSESLGSFPSIPAPFDSVIGEFERERSLVTLEQ